MKNLCLFVIVSFFSFAACSPKPSASVNQNPPASQALTLTYHGTGVVEAIDREKGKIEINHEAIKDYMDAMKMNYAVKDTKMLDDLKVGDRVDFTLEDRAGIVTITEIKKK